MILQSLLMLSLSKHGPEGAHPSILRQAQDEAEILNCATRLAVTEPNRAPHLSRQVSHLAIRAYQFTLSGLIGRQCRHLPTCSAYTDEAIQQNGFWPGSWMGLARICRCRPGGTSGFDPVPQLPEAYRWYVPWRGGDWRGAQIDPATRLDSD